MECRAAGVVPAEARLKLEAALVGLSGGRGEEYLAREVVLQSRNADEPDLHLVQRLLSNEGVVAAQDSKWEVWQYGLALRGKANAALPATPRPLARSECRGSDALAVWQGMGFSRASDCLKRGRRFRVPQGENSIEVLVYDMLPPMEAAVGDALEEPLATAGAVVEASLEVAAGGDHVSSAAAVKELATLLREHVRLGPLPIPPRRRTDA